MCFLQLSERRIISQKLKRTKTKGSQLYNIIPANEDGDPHSRDWLTHLVIPPGDYEKFKQSDKLVGTVRC